MFDFKRAPTQQPVFYFFGYSNLPTFLLLLLPPLPLLPRLLLLSFFLSFLGLQVKEMMRCLLLWSSQETRPALLPEEEEAVEAAARKQQLAESSEAIEIEQFMGRW